MRSNLSESNKQHWTRRGPSWVVEKEPNRWWHKYQQKIGGGTNISRKTETLTGSTTANGACFYQAIEPAAPSGPNRSEVSLQHCCRCWCVRFFSASSNTKRAALVQGPFRGTQMFFITKTSKQHQASAAQAIRPIQSHLHVINLNWIQVDELTRLLGNRAEF